MSGMNPKNGRKLSGIESIKASIANILFTPIGSRLQRREYGSAIPELIDQPQSEALKLQLMAAAVMSITIWEPRVRILEVGFSVDGPSSKINLDIERLDTGTQETNSIQIER